MTINEEFQTVDQWLENLYTLNDEDGCYEVISYFWDLFGCPTELKPFLPSEPDVIPNLSIAKEIFDKIDIDRISVAVGMSLCSSTRSQKNELGEKRQILFKKIKDKIIANGKTEEYADWAMKGLE